MTRLFQVDNPNPRKVFEVFFGKGVLLYEEGMEDRAKLVWNARRRLDREIGANEVQIIALAGVWTALHLYRNPGTTEAAPRIREYAFDYLSALLFSKIGVAHEVVNLADTCAFNYSPYLSLESSSHGSSWYRAAARDEMRFQLRFKDGEDVGLVVFAQEFPARFAQAGSLLAHSKNPRERLFVLHDAARESFEIILDRNDA